MLGIEYLRPSDALFWAKSLALSQSFFLLQLGDNSMLQRLTPVGVVGLNSGVSSISLGQVRCAFDLVVVPKLCFNAITGVDAACVGLR
jgi:hypothetical protein